jgi:hypothetical protein
MNFGGRSSRPERNGLRDPLIRVIRILSFFFAAAGLAWGADTAPTLEIRVVEGDGGVYAAGSRATRGVTVLVIDTDGRPVDGATVSFSLPSEGPGGVFASGNRTEAVTTHGDGHAAAWGMQWNRLAGPFEIRITAVKGRARATIISSQSLAPADKAVASSKVNRGGGNHKILWIAVAVAGAAVAGVAGASMGKSSSGAAATTSSTATTQIGTPTISLGHP